MTYRELLLKQIGIMEWTLRNPNVLHGKYAVSISDSTQLIIIADECINLDNSFIKDVLRAMMIDSSQVCCLLTKEVSLLPKQIIWPCWILGKQLPISSKKWIIYTLPLKDIYLNPQSKYTLWAQICQNKNNF